MKSVLQTEKECFICKTTIGLEEHHILNKFNKNKSEKLGLKVWLCSEHHRGKLSPHQNRSIDLSLKMKAQKYYENHIGTREQFIAEMGRSYL